MRKLIFTLAILLAVTCLSLTSNRSAVGESISPTAACKDCHDVDITCLDYAFPFYGVCRAAGGSQAFCESQTMKLYRNCVTANGCVPEIL